MTAEIKAVADPKPDPKAGQPRRVSGTPAPYYNLDQSIQVARVIHEQAGGSCERAQLASLLNYNGVKNGAFLTRVSAAKLYGLIDQEGDQIRTTDRGRTVIAPVLPSDAEKAKMDAFLNVTLFKNVFEEFNGRELPLEVGLRNLLATKYSVVPDRIGPTVSIMLDSAEQAGFFKVAGNRTKMVKPLLLGTMLPPPQHDAGMNGGAKDQPAGKTEEPVQRHGGGGGGGDGGDGGGIDPAIMGLLRRLPPAGTVLTTKRREDLIDAFTATVKFLYPEAE